MELAGPDAEGQYILKLDQQELKILRLVLLEFTQGSYSPSDIHLDSLNIASRDRILEVHDQLHVRKT